jgi:transcriptional regulator with XRE-family HTH domain
MSITAGALRAAIEKLGLTQVEFARLLDVSVGAVAQWLSAARNIPGPVEAYLNLLLRLPPSLQENETSRVKKGNSHMDGMYLIIFKGSAGEGAATLTFDNGKIYGFDEAGGIYDGLYRPGASPGMVEVLVNVQMKANQYTVAGGMSQPFDWTMQVTTTVPMGVSETEIVANTNLGHPIMAKIKYMRSLPFAA